MSSRNWSSSSTMSSRSGAGGQSGACRRAARCQARIGGQSGAGRRAAVCHMQRQKSSKTNMEKGHSETGGRFLVATAPRARTPSACSSMRRGPTRARSCLCTGTRSQTLSRRKATIIKTVAFENGVNAYGVALCLFFAARRGYGKPSLDMFKQSLLDAYKRI